MIVFAIDRLARKAIIAVVFVLTRATMMGGRRWINRFVMPRLTSGSPKFARQMS